MKASTDRIITTHAGSLPRPPELLKLIRAKVSAQPHDQKQLDAEITKAIDECVARQAKIGLDIISDGEFSKPSFLSYIVERLDGVTPTDEPFGQPWKGSREHNMWSEYYAWEAQVGIALAPVVATKRVVCNAPL